MRVSMQASVESDWMQRCFHMQKIKMYRASCEYHGNYSKTFRNRGDRYVNKNGGQGGFVTVQYLCVSVHETSGIPKPPAL